MVHAFEFKREQLEQLQQTNLKKITDKLSNISKIEYVINFLLYCVRHFINFLVDRWLLYPLFNIVSVSVYLSVYLYISVSIGAHCIIYNT